MAEIEDVSGLISGTARTEYVIANEGNLDKKEQKNKYRFNEGKIKYGDYECDVNAQSPFSPYTYKYIVRLDDTPVNWDQIFGLDPLLRVTKGLYMIKYVPRGCKDHRKGRPWKIGQDLIRWDIRVSGPKHWLKLCSTVPELDWLNRNSTFDLRMFDIAVQHPGMTFWFSVDWVMYDQKIKSQNKLDEGSLVSRKVSASDYIEFYKQKDKTILIRYFNDILKEINDAERDSAVQQEMAQYAGEGYDRSRKCPRDPVTGRFINKKQEEE